MAEYGLTITQTDFQKLSLLVQSVDSPTAILLEEELARASVVADDQNQKDFVTMNSTVRFLDVELGKENEVTVVYPHEANLSEQKISVLAPMGAALIGLRVGQKIEWPFPNGKAREIQVLAVKN